MANGKLGRIYNRKNTTHEFGSATEHKWLRIEDTDGNNERWIRFSERDLSRMEESASKNMEDAPDVSFLRNLLD